MQTSPQQQTPLPPSPPTITVTGADGKAHVLSIPTTGRELNELYTRRQELNNELASATSRRRTVAGEMAATADPAAHTGLQQRLAILDQRIIQLETDIAAADRQITAAAPAVFEESRFQRQATGDDFAEGFAAGAATLFAAMTILLVFVRRRWKRRAKAGPVTTGADSPRLQRVEQAVDAIAVEVERISEGQRFVTKLLSESAAASGSQRIAPPVGATPPKSI